MATSEQIKKFIQEFGRLAVAECNRRIANNQPIILPSVCIAQSALETGWGTSGLMTKANAYFGIKAGGSWTGAVYRADTWEVANGQSYNTTANFRAYSSKEESVADYYNLITSLSRYSDALSYGKDRSKWLTPKATITAIWAGGYATDTLYVEKIMSTINARNLTEFDALITGEGELLPSPSNSYNFSDLVDGILITTDSGRSIGNDSTNANGKAINWDNALNITADSTYTIVADFASVDEDGNEPPYSIYIATLLEDTATISGPLYHGTQVSFTKGQKVGYYILKKDSATWEGIENSIVYLNNNTLPSGEEVTTTPIAYFVKIE